MSDGCVRLFYVKLNEFQCGDLKFNNCSERNLFELLIS